MGTVWSTIFTKRNVPKKIVVFSKKNKNPSTPPSSEKKLFCFHFSFETNNTDCAH